MYFQILDEKNKCVGVYYNGKLKFNTSIDNQKCKRTWGFFPDINEGNYEYASLYCQGKSLNQVCPPHLREEWEKQQLKFKAFVNSFKEAKINLKEHCFFDLVPEDFLKEFCEIKNKITQYVFENIPKPANYDYLLSLSKMYLEIKNNRLNIINNLKETKNKKFWRYINYDIVGTKTGRARLHKNSFPILTLKKEYRSILRPNNDMFMEMDYNAAEVRVFLGLMGVQQPKEDIHEWNRKNVFKSKHPQTLTRQEAKKTFFTWFYYPGDWGELSWAKDLELIYRKDRLLDKFYDGKKVITPYGDEIKADRDHALNYLIQGTTARMVLEKAMEINDFLKGKKTLTSHIVHDSMVLDYSEKDLEYYGKIVGMFRKTRFGDFRVQVSIGKNYGDMRKCLI